MHETITGWLRGLEIIRERFLRLLEREGIERIPDINQRFDPHLHVAVDTEERTDVAENTIVSVIRKGYIYNDRVLRYSEVIVAKSPQEQVEMNYSAYETHETHEKEIA
jgi:molecular chaperone GrpE